MRWSGDGRALAASKSYTGDQQITQQVPVAGETTDEEVIVGIDVSHIQAIYMKSDVDMKVETNDGTTPDDTIDLVANVPYVWTTDSYDSCLLTVNITALYLTVAGAIAGTFELEVLVDSTP
jgi:hypothetical protein